MEKKEKLAPCYLCRNDFSDNEFILSTSSATALYEVIKLPVVYDSKVPPPKGERINDGFHSEIFWEIEDLNAIIVKNYTADVYYINSKGTLEMYALELRHFSGMSKKMELSKKKTAEWYAGQLQQREKAKGKSGYVPSLKPIYKNSNLKVLAPKNKYAYMLIVNDVNVKIFRSYFQLEDEIIKQIGTLPAEIYINEVELDYSI